MSDLAPQTEFVPPPNCWRGIGTWGNSTCPRLHKMLHCHNCDVYAQSGRHQLEQPLTEDYRRQWSELLARPKETEPTDTTSVVIFRIGTHWLALPTAIFKQALDPRPIHRVPHRTNKIFLGIVPVSGDLHLAFSLRDLLSFQNETTAAQTQRAFPRMVTIEKEGSRWVFAVDEMRGLHELSPGETLPLPPDENDPASAYFVSLFELDSRAITLIDDGLLFAALKRNLQ